MDEIPDFRDFKAVKTWLEGQPQAVSVTIAAQAALRVVPLGEELFSQGYQEAGVVILSILRATLTASVAAVGPTEAVKAAYAGLLRRRLRRDGVGGIGRGL